MDKFIVLLNDHGVYGIAEERSYGITCTYYLDGIAYLMTFEPDEYEFVAYLSD